MMVTTTIQKTVKLPVSPEITKRKLGRIEKLSARLTFAVSLYLNIIVENDITTRKEANRYQRVIAEQTGLSSAFVQCARDRALEMYRGYKKLHEKWKKKVKKLEKSLERARASKNKNRVKKLEKKLKRLIDREPSPPSVNKKPPIFFDRRIGEIVFSTCKKFKVWAKISTLRKYETIYIPLITYPYADDHLKWKIKGFRLLYNYRLKRWEVHVTVEREIEVHAKGYAGIDLGMKRLAYIKQVNKEGENRVLSFPKEDHRHFFRRMHELNNRIAKLQRKGKIKALKKLKNKRRNVALDFRRKLAKDVASNISNTVVFIGYPRNIREEHYKGNGNKLSRKRLNRWAFKEFGDILILKLRENENHAIFVGETYSTRTCSICGSRNTVVEDRNFYCKNCGVKFDRDENGATNILLIGMKKTGLDEVMLRAGAVVTRPLSVDDGSEELPEHTTSLQGVSSPVVGEGCSPF